LGARSAQVAGRRKTRVRDRSRTTVPVGRSTPMVRSRREWYRTARLLRRQLGRRRNRAGGVRTISELRTRVITGIDGRQDTVAPAAGSIATEPRPADDGRLLGNRSRSAARSRTSPLPLLGVWFFRGLLVIPFVLMAPESLRSSWDVLTPWQTFRRPRQTCWVRPHSCSS